MTKTAKSGPISHDEVLDTLLSQINALEVRASVAAHDPDVDEIRRTIAALQLAYRALGGETEPAEITNDTMITGSEWREFYKHNWPKEFHIDDVATDFEDERGNYILPDEGLYRLGDFGMMGYHGPPCDKYQSSCLYPIAPFYAEFRNGKSGTTTMAFRIAAKHRPKLTETALSLGGVPIG